MKKLEPTAKGQRGKAKAKETLQTKVFLAFSLRKLDVLCAFAVEAGSYFTASNATLNY